jgi:hypothetical protein
VAPRKRRTGRKGAAGKPAKPTRERRKHAAATKPTAGIGHNKPPLEATVPHAAPPNISNWHIADQTAQIAHQTAARQRNAAAAMNSMSFDPLGPLPLRASVTSDPRLLHEEMRKRIAALEETIANLPTAPGGPLGNNELEEIKNEIAKLKTQPPVPAQPPTDAVEAESKLRKFGEKVLSSLATQAVSEASKAIGRKLWASYGDQLIALAKSIGEWIASLL